MNASEVDEGNVLESLDVESGNPIPAPCVVIGTANDGDENTGEVVAAAAVAVAVQAGYGHQ